MQKQAGELDTDIPKSEIAEAHSTIAKLRTSQYEGLLLHLFGTVQDREDLRKKVQQIKVWLVAHGLFDEIAPVLRTRVAEALVLR